MISDPATSPRRVADAQRRRKALLMRQAGMPYEAIAAAEGEDGQPLYSSRQAAHRAVQTALREITREPATELRAVELSRLDRMQLAVWPEASQPRHAVRCPQCEHVLWREVNLSAVSGVLRIMERRAALAGLDARHTLDARALDLVADQVEMVHSVIVRAMTRAGLSPAVQTEILEYAAEDLRATDRTAAG